MAQQKKFLSLSGLQYLITKIKNYFVTLTTNQTISGTKTFTKEVGITENANIKYNPSTDRIEFNFTEGGN
jgi:hypothetical protein